MRFKELGMTYKQLITDIGIAPSDFDAAVEAALRENGESYPVDFVVLNTLGTMHEFSVDKILHEGEYLIVHRDNRRS